MKARVVRYCVFAFPFLVVLLCVVVFFVALLGGARHAAGEASRTPARLMAVDTAHLHTTVPATR